nr:glycosyltransferase family A protein [Candidatus Frankia alpina]
MVPALGPGAIPPREQVAHCSRAVVDPTSVTVVVCTRNRSAMLPAYLSGLQALDHPDLEVVIVDNAPSDDSTRAVFDRLVGSSARRRGSATSARTAPGCPARATAGSPRRGVR